MKVFVRTSSTKSCARKPLFVLTFSNRVIQIDIDKTCGVSVWHKWERPVSLAVVRKQSFLDKFKFGGNHGLCILSIISSISLLAATA